MADPLSIIGAAGTVANILEITCKVISKIKDFHDRWQDAEFDMLNIASQLVPFKNSLIWIQEWLMACGENDQYHQFTMDLDLTLKCCHRLVSKVESYTNEIVIDECGEISLETRAKLRIAKDTKTLEELQKMIDRQTNALSLLLEELQKMIDRQTNALSLLLTVCGCESVSEQHSLLSKSSSRKIFKGVQRDTTASLLVHYDNGSLFSRVTDNLSKLSWVFDFDPEVLLSGPYERAFRSSLRNSLRRFKKDKEKRTSEKTVLGSLGRRWSTEAVNGDAIDGDETQCVSQSVTNQVYGVSLSPCLVTQSKQRPYELDSDRWSIEAVAGGPAEWLTDCMTSSPPHENQHLEPVVYNGDEVTMNRFLSGEIFHCDYLEGANVDSQVVDSHRIYELDAVSTQLFELNADDRASIQLLESNTNDIASIQLPESSANDIASTQLFELNADDRASTQLLESNAEGTIPTQLLELDAQDTEINTLRARKLVDSKDKILLNVASKELRYFRELRSLAESQSSMSYY
ncbi:hypothetical protein F4803DRAFT_294885 [Xylaria telfairii]|nr:hypothetical protein F4803DRAFT_294885 [Xylaria telfairii]